MRLICSYCQKDLGPKPPLDDGSMSHGMCGACAEYFNAQWKGMSYAEYLERFPYPVILVEGQVRVVALNHPASELLGRGPEETVGLLGGEALECVHARLPGGCGKTVHCATCSIRNSVTWTHDTGEALSHVPATLRQGRQSIDLLVSTAKDGKLVRVTVEPADD